MTFIVDFDNASFLGSTREALAIFKFLVGWMSYCYAYRHIDLNNFNIMSLPLDKVLVYCRRDATISVDLVMTKEQTVCSFSIDDEESSR